MKIKRLISELLTRKAKIAGAEDYASYAVAPAGVTAVGPEICDYDPAERVKIVTFSKLNVSLKPRKIYRIPNGRIHFPLGAVSLPNGAFLRSRTVFPSRLTLAKETRYWFHPNVKSIKVDFPVFSLVGLYATEYAHWWFETLPSLWRVLEEMPAGVRVFVPDKMSSWQKRTLRLAGLDEKSLRECPKTPCILHAPHWCILPIPS